MLTNLVEIVYTGVVVAPESESGKKTKKSILGKGTIGTRG